MTPDLAITCAIVAAPMIGLYAVARQRDNLRARLALVTDALVDANGRALRAEARLDLIHDQRVRAGRAAHRNDELDTLRAATVERLRHAAPNPPRPRAEIEAEVAAARAARKAATCPLASGGLAAPGDQTAGEASASPAFVTRAEQRRRPLISTAEQKGLAHG